MKKIIMSMLVVISIATILSGFVGMRKGMARTINLERHNKIKLLKNSDVGNGKVNLLTPSIDSTVNQLEFIPSDFDESKLTFVYVGSKKVFEGKLKNGRNFSINITNVANAHRTNYKNKVQFVQYKNDMKKKDIQTLKQVQYACK